MKNPAAILPEAMAPVQALWAAAQKGGVPEKLLHLVHLRVSQINGCSVCIDGGWRGAKKDGETDERLFAVAAWQHAPYFSDAERTALALAEALTRIADRPDPVSDEVYDAAKKHFDERQLAALILAVATVNVWNRCNVATAQIAGAWKP
ncbi:MAG: carboxymuconolactone decarboxylase family protein [Myxococcaceae bacterium]